MPLPIGEEHATDQLFVSFSTLGRAERLPQPLPHGRGIGSMILERLALTGMNAFSTRHTAAQWSRHSCYAGSPAFVGPGMCSAHSAESFEVRGLPTFGFGPRFLSSVPCGSLVPICLAILHAPC